MTPAPGPRVQVWELTERRGDRVKSPWIVRWAVNGRERSRSFDVKVLADDFRARLLLASRAGERFDVATGEPVSWTRSAQVSMYDWARRWLSDEWQSWAPRTRTSAVEALSRWLPLVVADKAPNPPAGLRSFLVRALPPDGRDSDDACARWVARWVLQLGDLTPALLASIETDLHIGDDGAQLKEVTVNRWLSVAKACVNRAVQLELLDRSPWPPRPKGRKRRKQTKKASSMAVDVRRLPEPATVHALLPAMVSHQPGSRMYRAMTACMAYAGLRPSEVVDLPLENVTLPPDCWGRIAVLVADVGFADPAESGEPKTGPRHVPIPPLLVAELRAWIDEAGIVSGPLFRTRSGQRPSPSNWGRALKRGCVAVGTQRIRIYDLRHACATLMLRAGVPVGEAALRLGHTVETLLSTYAGVLEADEELANQRIEAALA